MHLDEVTVDLQLWDGFMIPSSSAILRNVKCVPD
jgi:hypothetical protein